jgi:hypothetical protein
VFTGVVTVRADASQQLALCTTEREEPDVFLAFGSVLLQAVVFGLDWSGPGG